MKPRRVMWLKALVLTLIVPATSLADGEAPRAKNAGGLLGLWNVRTMIDNNCTTMARRYNLTEEQDKYTRKLMAERVARFLDRHESDLRDLLQELLYLQLRRQTPDVDRAKQLGAKALPLFEEARKEILQANQEWREVLTEQQKRIHDGDLDRMQANFARMEQQFTRWKEGKFEAGKDGLGAPFISPVRHRPRPRPTSRPLASSLPPVGPLLDPYSYWDQWVKRFIKIYRLDEAQEQTALSILKECRERAIQYREAHKEELDKATARVHKLIQSRADRQEIRDAVASRSKLSQPINEIFRELMRRLNEIPTDTQRQMRATTQPEHYRVPRYKVQQASSTKPGHATSKASEPESAPDDAAEE